MRYDDYNIIPIGDHCAISIALKELGLRTKSYPFDWVTHKKELHDTNIIYNVNLIKDLERASIKDIVNKYIGNAFENEDKINNDKMNEANNICFPHDSGTITDIFEKYERRFNRLHLHIKNQKTIFILLTRHYYINENDFSYIMKILLGYNSDNIILFISGTDHPYLYEYENVIFKHIWYDITKFFNYDYTVFRPRLKEYFATLFL